MFRVLFSLLIVPLCLVLFLFSAQSMSADETKNYDTSYNVTYTIDEDGTAHTVMKIGLTNLTSVYYASTYRVQLGFSDVTNIKASDAKGAITPVLKKKDIGLQVELDMNDKVVGKGNTLYFTLSFDTRSVAKKQGKLWEITIPSTSKQDTFSSFTVQVIPPASFGTPSVVRPHRSSKHLFFTKDELKTSGISLIFGKEQSYDYTLQYHLKNTNLYPISTEVALPPSTSYQESTIESIYPKPANVLLDEDGNWLARYQLKPGKKIDVTVKGKATVSLTPKKSDLTKEQITLYTKELPYWQLSADAKKRALELKSAKNIYDYVVHTLEYDYLRRTSTTETRIGAQNILKRPTEAVCLEFTDLFIALARAAGIPSREVDGYAYTDDEGSRPLSLVPDILHAWPEYYDFEAKSWIMVDPTWGNTTGGLDYFTTLDLSHVAFVVKGKDSSYPIPAGGYKLSRTDQRKDISVSFSNQRVVSVQNFSFHHSFEKKYVAGLPMTGTVSVTNIEHSLLPQQVITITSDTLSPRKQQVVIGPVPPFGTVTKDVTFHKTSFLTKGAYDFTMVIADQKIHESFAVTPFILTIWHLIGGSIFAVFTITVLIITHKTRRLSLLRR